MSNTKRISTGSIRNEMRKLQISKHLNVLPTAENERLKKRNNELEIQNLQTTRNWFNDLHNTNSKLSNLLKK